MSDGKCFEVEVLAERSSSVPGVGGVGEQCGRETFDQSCRNNSELNPSHQWCLAAYTDGFALDRPFLGVLRASSSALSEALVLEAWVQPA